MLNNRVIFGKPASELLGSLEAEGGTEVSALLMDMTQAEFAEQMVALVSCVIDKKEEEEERTELDGYVLGGGGGSSPALDAILMG